MNFLCFTVVDGRIDSTIEYDAVPAEEFTEASALFALSVFLDLISLLS